MKRLILITMLVLSCTQMNGQDDDVKKVAAASHGLKDVKDTGWIKGGFFSTNISNTSFSNWAGGGTNNTSIIANSSLFAIYRPDSMNSIWENYLDLAYGLMRNGNAKVIDPASTYYGKKNPFIKNEDKLVFTTKYGRKINEN